MNLENKKEIEYKKHIINHIENNASRFLVSRKQQLDFWINYGRQDDCSVVVFGAALMGEKVCSYLEELKVNITCICDNDSNKWGGSFVTCKGTKIPIVSPDEAFEDAKEILCFLAVGEHLFTEIKQQLLSYNVKHIFANKYIDFYLESMIMFLNLTEDEICYKIELLMDLYNDDESFKILWCHFKEILGIEEVADNLQGVDFYSTYIQPQYFFDNGKYLGRQQVMVDCGAYIGDTLDSLINEVGYDDFDKYICFELDNENYKHLKEVVENASMETRQRIETYNVGVGERNHQIKYNYNGGNSAVMDNGSLTAEIVSLDELLGDEEISFIKMDIEGSEQQALQGAQDIIRRKKPICAICIYHSVKDFFEIPFILKEFVPEYKFFLKNHSNEWCDTVCYAKVEEK